MLYSLKNLLRREFEVYTARSGEEGMKILQEHEIHLVMTEQRMPQMSGVELLHRMKTEFPGAMRLIFTGYADIKTVIDAINHGNVFRYITSRGIRRNCLSRCATPAHGTIRLSSGTCCCRICERMRRGASPMPTPWFRESWGRLTDEGKTDGLRLLSDGRALALRLDVGLAGLTDPMC